MSTKPPTALGDGPALPEALVRRTMGTLGLQSLCGGQNGKEVRLACVVFLPFTCVRYYCILQQQRPTPPVARVVELLSPRSERFDGFRGEKKISHSFGTLSFIVVDNI